MSNIPEGVTPISAEGTDLRSALVEAATQLGVSLADVAHSIDLSHFRNAGGVSQPRTTVKVLAWKRVGDEPALALRPEGTEPPKREEREERPRRDRDDRRGRDRDDRRGRDRDDRPRRDDRDERPRRDDRDERPRHEEREERPREGRIPDPVGATSASERAATWFRELLAAMDIPAEISATGDAERIRLKVKAESAGRIIGRRGTTLAAIRHLLSLLLADLGAPIVDVDVDDPREGGREERPRREDRPREERRDDRRDDRRPRGDRRDDRRDDRRGRDDRREGGRGEPRSTFPEEKLQEIARRAAEKAVATGKPITINLQLNSYDRRVIHLEISEIRGVSSESVVKDDVKYIQVRPA